METLKFSNFCNAFARKNNLTHEQVDSLLSEVFEKSFSRAIKEGSFELKKNFILSAYSRDFKPGEKVKINNVDKTTMKKIIISAKLPDRYKQFTFEPEGKYLVEYQKSLESKNKKK